MAADGHLNFDTKLDESGFSSGIKKLGNIAKSGLAVVGTAVAGGVAAFGALTKSALDSVASLEQNVGGVETLFKNSAETVITNAKKAYTTAGLSANAYMETVTSFSASLLQSLGNDTEKAAEYADRAVIDMSDNANKMGTSMELIQNAYQGFAKQNYTMLDNLKLGYGGTKEEMKRLIKDASQLKDVQEELGITVDESSMSFGNIVNAISVMQKSMGIAGTTAKEAATTIEGSMNSAKAAWDNFLSGAGTAEEFADAFGVAAEVIVKNLGEIVPRLAETVPEVAKAIYEQFTTAFEENGSQMFDTGSQIIADILTGIVESIPELSNVALTICGSLLEAIKGTAPQLLAAGNDIFQYVLDGMEQLTQSAPDITEQAGQIVSKLISGIQENAPSMITAAAEMIASFASGIGEQLPSLVPQALQMIVTLADSIISNIPTIVSAGIDILKGLVQGIINGLPTLITEAPRIINEFANAIYSAIGQLITTGWEMIKSLAQGIWDNRGLIKENAGAIFEAIINLFSLSKMVSLGKNLISSMASGIEGLGPKITTVGKNILKNLVSGIKSLATHPVTTLKSIATKAMNAFKNVNWVSVGKNIISGIANGLAASAGAIVDAAKNAAKKALDAAKDFLGIHSPSTVFRDVIGKNMALGMGIGFEKNVPVGDVENSIDDIINKAQNRIASVESSSPVGVSGIVKDVTNNYTGETINYKQMKKAQLEAMNEANERPVMLERRQINRILRDGGVVLA